LEKGKISDFQLSSLIIGFVFGSSIILSPGGSTGHDTWIAILLGLIEGLLIAWIYTSLAKRFRDKNIIQINSIVYGKYLGSLVSILFIWYLFHLGAMVLNNYVRFFTLELYPATPKAVGLLLLMLVCAATVGRGIEVLARCSFILITSTIFVVFLGMLLVIPHININNLLPIFDVPFGEILQAAYGAASSPFAETVAFLMVLPILSKPEKGPRAVTRGLLIAGLILVAISAVNAAVLGQMIQISNYPSYLTLQTIDISDIFTRVEALVAINLITMGFIKISILFYGTVLGLAQVFHLKSYKLLIIPIGILMVILALTNVGNTIEMFDFAIRVYPIYAVPFQIGIPFVTLMVAKLRKLR
jgi:spore germination protein KB